MEQQVDLSALDGRQIDPETFRRVWARVMPDQRDSPLVLDPPAQPPRNGKKPEEKGKTLPRERRVPENKPKKEEKNAPRERDGERLEELMDLALEGAEETGTLARRMGNRGREMMGVAEDHRRALRRLAAAYFLLTGRRRRPESRSPGRHGNLEMDLRERFLWERRWEKACREGAEGAEDPALKELCRELSQDASLHQRTIRATLERMWGGTVDGPRRHGVN